MEIDDQAFLDQIEQNIREKDNEQDVAKREAEQRAREMERIRKASVNVPGASAPKPAAAPQKKNPLEDDPRYKEYFERLRRQKGEAPAQTPAPAGAVQQGQGQSTPAKAGTESQVVGPGAIVRFDDGSIGIYKDAVSGRNYALFYFLHPEGQFDPEGVFLQCYQAKVIGNLPENYFAELREKNTWDRDMIVFHLSRFEHVNFLNNLSEHEDRKPKNTTPARTASQPAPAAVSKDTPAAAEKPASVEQARTQTPTSNNVPQQTASAPSNEPAPAESNTLVKGRKFQIVFGGKKWEAVFWASDENGAIVAHDTHGDWSLMRLDLDRFKDSLQLAEIVDSDTINAITESVPKG